MASTTLMLRSRPRRRHRTPGERLPREVWMRFAACTAAAALLQLDGTVITVALPNVARGLHVSGAGTSAVLSVYFAAFAVTLMPSGHLVDRIGARPVALVGLSLFALAALAGALSPDMASLLTTRAVQGLGAGLVSPAALAGAVRGFPADRRASALGIWGASAGLCNLAGPLLGGVLTVLFGWRGDWWALVPLTVLAIWAISVQLPRGVSDEATPSSARVLNRIVCAAAGVAALTFAVMIGTFYLAEQYLQRAAGFSSLGAATALLVVALCVGAAGPPAGRLVDRSGESRTAAAGFLGVSIGLAVLGISGFPLHTPLTIVPLITVGLGLGLLFVPASRAALNSAPQAMHGRISAVLSIGRMLGAAAGAGGAGLAISGGLTAGTVHTALLLTAAVAVSLGIPLSALLSSARRAPVRLP